MEHSRRRRDVLTNTLVAITAAAGLGLGGCTAALVGGAAAGGYYLGKDERSAGQIADDAAITTKVKTAFARDDLVRALDVNVDTYNGVVVLNGIVRSDEALERAEELASAVKGVKEVRNKLEVVSGD